MASDRQPLIDADVHCAVPSSEALLPYLTEHWRGHVREAQFQQPGPINLTYPTWSTALATPGAKLSLDALRRDVLDRADLAILHCYYGVEGIQHPYLGPALATAVNDWLRDEWLERDQRLLGSAVVTPQFAQAAAEEIARIADDRRFIQVLMPAESREPYGNQRYWAIWEAAAEHDLVVAITRGGAGGVPSQVGWMGSFFEAYATAALTFQAQMTSLIFGGVFDRWPNLKVTFAESGWTWLPGHMWRLDMEWRSFTREVAWLKGPPSTYVRRHFRFTTQPADAPHDATQLCQILEELGSDDLLLYASDYPHAYGPAGAPLLAQLTLDQAARVMWANAANWYGLSDRAATLT